MDSKVVVWITLVKMLGQVLQKRQQKVYSLCVCEIYEQLPSHI